MVRKQAYLPTSLYFFKKLGTLKLENGTIIQMFKHLVREGRIPLDLDRPICFDDPRRNFPGGL